MPFSSLSAEMSLRLCPAVFDDGVNAGQSVDAGIDHEAEFIDQAVFEKLAVDNASTFEDDLFNAKELSNLVHRFFQIVAVGSCKQVGDVVFTQVGEVGFGNIFAEYGDEARVHDDVCIVEDFAV